MKAAGRAASCLLLVLSFVLYGLALRQYGLLRDRPSVWQILCGEEGLTRDRCQEILDLEALREDASLRCAFWRERKGQTIENPVLGRSTEADLWEVRGSAEVLTSDFVSLGEEDQEGCYLDEESARELFGGTDVAGLQILWGDREFTLRGVLEGGEKVMLFRPEGKEPLDRVTLGELPGSSEGASFWTSPAPEFMLRYGITGTSYEDSFLPEILKLFLLVFPVTLAGSFLVLMRRILKETFPPSPARLLWWLFLLLILWILLRQIHIPAHMIPDRWSDFGFWRTWREAYAGNIRHYAEYARTSRELGESARFLKGILLAAAAPLVWCAAGRPGRR